MAIYDNEEKKTIRKMLSVSASKDETRFHLCGVHYSESGQWVATDGHRMAVVTASGPELGCLETAPVVNGLYDAKIFEKDARLLPLVNAAKYPNYKQLIPNFEGKSVNSITWEVPKWVEGVKHKKGPPPVVILDATRGVVAVETSAKLEGECISVNLSYLAPLAGLLCRFTWLDNLSPILVEPKDTKGISWQYIVMPLRRESGKLVVNSVKASPEVKS